MAPGRPLGKIAGPLVHLPTWFFIIGYPVFWLELYEFKSKDGVTSPLAWSLFALVAVVSCSRWMREPKDWRSELTLFWSSLRFSQRLLWTAAFVLAGTVVLMAVLAAAQPIHLTQEFDCLQYHYALPRQHLILGSFAHIPWAADDLFLLPIDFALAPFWFITVFPNKLPQLIIMFGLIAVLVRLSCALASLGRSWVPMLVVLAFLGSHGLGVQMGTAMLDLTVTYLFFAALDSLRTGQRWLGAVEGTFFVWSKPLMPVQVVIVVLLMAAVLGAAKCLKGQVVWGFVFKHWRRALGAFILLSLLVAGPFIVKSIHYAATPLFPLAPGIMGPWAKIETNPQAWHSLQQASQMWMNTVKDGYGHGRDLIAFLKHWWLLAVPEGSVNNAFDYPMGLPYLLFLIPFLFYFVTDLIRRRLCPWSVLALLVWGLWWFGSQQARFLYIPLLIIFIVTAVRFTKMSQCLLACLVAALALHVVSLWRAHNKDFLRPSFEVLRTQDQKLVVVSRNYFQHGSTGYVDWPQHDVAYAQFPVVVHKERLPHTVAF
ncbi:MAG: hypothetical protein HY209_00565 [Candidatus Omnitrophica bacterium]|nr:hypothetical protein [Candidatus Omnitrophota bacterium]